MAATLGVKQEILDKYVFEPLQGLYDQRHARQQEVDIRNGHFGNDEVHINGQRFAIGTSSHPGMGYFQTAANDVSFCINKEAANACRFALFGKLPESKKYLYSKASASRVVGASDYAMDGMLHAIEDAYHGRNNYQRSLDVSYGSNGETHHAKFKLNSDVVFCIERNRPQLFFTADGLKHLYQLAHGASEAKAQEWWQSHPDKLTEVKTPDWLNKDEIMARIGIHGRSTTYPAFEKVWKKMQQDQKKPESELPVQVAMKRNETAPSQRKELCVGSDAIEWIKEQMSNQAVDGGAHAARAASVRGNRNR